MRYGLEEPERSGDHEPEARATMGSVNPNSKSRGDEQKPDTRCDILGTSGHVTAKSSICALGMFYKSGVYAMKVSCLTSGDLLNCPGKLRAAEIGWELSNQF